ncbi:MAG: Crp/Fnr family transcriptional regulator [Epsilonproteobacteria bacterium]|nr:Crp/Fnr family transcriptional regulator [Campylobacterota bacterium]
MELEDLPIFELVDKDAIDELKRYGKIKSFFKGSVPLTSEDTIKYFYIILEGRLKVSEINMDTSKEQTINILVAGDMFDVIPLLDGKPHEVLTSALDNGKFLEIPIDIVKDLLMKNTSFNKIFFPYLAKTMRHLENLVVDLSLFDTSTRLMRLLLRNLDLKNPPKLKIINDLSHEEIANLIGTVRHVVNRHIQDLKKDGVLDVKRKRLTINNINSLLAKLQPK